MNICPQNECTSCGACVSVCPKNCIKFVKNNYGYDYPLINQIDCIGCGKCSQVCHVINKNSDSYPFKAYAAWSNDEQDRKTSTSGGVASVFYNAVVAAGGVGYGAVFEDDLGVKIKGCSNNEIVKFKNSKYVHSDMKKCFYRDKNRS